MIFLVLIIMTDLNNTQLDLTEASKKVSKSTNKKTTKKINKKNITKKFETDSESGTLNLNNDQPKVIKKKTIKSKPSKKVVKQITNKDTELKLEIDNETKSEINNEIKSEVDTKSKQKIIKDDFKHSPNKFIAMNLDSISHKNEDLVESNEQKILHRLSTIERELINKSIEYNDLKVEFHKLSQFVYKVLNNINKTHDDTPMDINAELMINLN